MCDSVRNALLHHGVVPLAPRSDGEALDPAQENLIGDPIDHPGGDQGDHDEDQNRQRLGDGLTETMLREIALEEIERVGQHRGRRV